jgi:hypothetical protein
MREISFSVNAITAFTSQDVEIGNVEIPVGRLYGPALKKRAGELMADGRWRMFDAGRHLQVIS